ncbi:hypothetical protein VNO77_27018 [Canavalia gladiata]|uniref:Uncharacterized protein n=1 Tax=Canavalia gladiata TaxID=3824 RepID=A0AAN9Q635_CANGL
MGCDYGTNMILFYMRGPSAADLAWMPKSKPVRIKCSKRDSNTGFRAVNYPNPSYEVILISEAEVRAN